MLDTLIIVGALGVLFVVSKRMGLLGKPATDEPADEPADESQSPIAMWDDSKNILRLLRLNDFEISNDSNLFGSHQSIQCMLTRIDMSELDFVALAARIEHEMPKSLADENPIWGAIECLRFLEVEKEYGNRCVPSTIIAKAIWRETDDINAYSTERTVETYLNSTVYAYGPFRREWWCECFETCECD